MADLGVNGTTVAYNAVEKYVGFGNVCFYAALALLSSVTSYGVFPVRHAVPPLSEIYLCVLRKGVAFGAFKRDVLLFKSIAAHAIICIIRVAAVEGDDVRTGALLPPDSLVLIIAGYFVSLCATAALGVDGTYFGIELGVVKADYKFVSEVPLQRAAAMIRQVKPCSLLGLHVVPQVGPRGPI